MDQPQNLIVLFLLVLAVFPVFLLFGNSQGREQTSQLRKNNQILRNIDQNTAATAKSIQAMCRDAVTPPGSLLGRGHARPDAARGTVSPTRHVLPPR